MIEVIVLLGNTVVDSQEFDDEDEAMDYAAEMQDKGYKVRVMMDELI